MAQITTPLGLNDSPTIPASCVLEASDESRRLSSYTFVIQTSSILQVLWWTYEVHVHVNFAQ
jgi:hypothetical protein